MRKSLRGGRGGWAALHGEAGCRHARLEAVEASPLRGFGESDFLVEPAGLGDGAHEVPGEVPVRQVLESSGHLPHRLGMAEVRSCRTRALVDSVWASTRAFCGPSCGPTPIPPPFAPPTGWLPAAWMPPSPCGSGCRCSAVKPPIGWKFACSLIAAPRRGQKAKVKARPHCRGWR